MKRRANIPVVGKLETLMKQVSAGEDWPAVEIRQGLTEILLSNAPEQGLEALYQLGVLMLIFPELAACDIPQGSLHRHSALIHSFKTAAAIKPELHLRLAALLHDSGKAGTFKWEGGRPRFPGHAEAGARIAVLRLTELGYAPELVSQVERLVRRHMFELGPAAAVEELERLVIRVGPDMVMDLLELRRADIVACGTSFDSAALDSLRTMAGRLSGIAEEIRRRGNVRIERERGGEN